MDKFDQQIVAILRDDARTSVTEIARQINLSRSATAERIKALESSGFIRGYHADISQQDSPSVRAYFELHYREHNCQAYAERLKRIPEVKICHTISGHVDMLLYVEASSMERLDQVRLEIESMEKIVMVRTHMVLRDMFTR